MAISGSGSFNIDPATDTVQVAFYSGDAGVATIDSTGGGFVETILNFDVGAGFGSSGTLTLDGAGVDIDVEDPGTAGFDGSIRVGQDGAFGSVTIQNGAQLTSTNTAYYDAGLGYLVGGYNNVKIGQTGSSGGGTGIVTVTGTGSTLEAFGTASRIDVGRFLATGTLNVLDGAFAGTLQFQISRGLSGTLNVDGPGSRVLASNDYGDFGIDDGGIDYSGRGARVAVGRSINVSGSYDGESHGIINVTNGGVIDIENIDGQTDGPSLFIAQGELATGTVTVSGAGSQINVVQAGPRGDDGTSGAFIGVGMGGKGMLTIEDNGEVNVLGDFATVNVGDESFQDGAETSKESAIDIRTGGVLNILSQGFNDGGIQIGRREISDGRVTVDGAGSELNVSHFITVGRGGNGVLEILNGGKTTIAGSTSDFPGMTIGRGEDGAPGRITGKVVVDGLGSSLEVDDFISVARGGNGILDVLNGGTVTIQSSGRIFPGMQIGRGLDDGSADVSGVVTVDGAGSAITISGPNANGFASGGSVSVGSRLNSEGTLIVRNGGSFENTGTNAAMSAGSDPGTRGTILIDGTGSLLDAGTRLAIGTDYIGSSGAYDPAIGGEGMLTLSGGATLIADDVVVGESGVVDLSGTLTGDLALHGLLEIDGDAVGALIVDGDFEQGERGDLAIDISDFASGSGDTLSVTGNASFATRRGDFTVAIDDALNFNLGDTYTLANATGNLNAETAVIYDTVRGIELQVSKSGSDLILTAMEQVGDSFTGDGTANTIAGTRGNDTIDGLSGNDILNGGNGRDVLNGGGGADILRGGAQSDTALGGSGSDTLYGNSGDDELRGGTSADVLRGGAGNDLMFGDGFNDELYGSFGADVMSGGGGTDTMRGGNGTDTLSGNNAKDFLFGDDGNDSLNGGAGNDEIDGGTGRDILNGSTGDDLLTGGLGADIFSFRANHGTFDRITDFEDGTDTIQFDINTVNDIGDLTITDKFNGAEVDYGTGQIRVLGVAAADLTDSDFEFL